MKKAIQSGLYNCGLFSNTHFISTSILRSAGESLSAYESRCFVTSARWLLDHLRGVAPVKILTDELLPDLPLDDQLLVSRVISYSPACLSLRHSGPSDCFLRMSGAQEVIGTKRVDRRGARGPVAPSRRPSHRPLSLPLPLAGLFRPALGARGCRHQRPAKPPSDAFRQRRHRDGWRRGFHRPRHAAGPRQRAQILHPGAFHPPLSRRSAGCLTFDRESTGIW